MSEDVFTPTGGEVSPVDTLVGEGKKFADVNALAKGKQEADSYIEQLQEENKTAREKLAELEGKEAKEDQVADLLKAVREHQQQAPVSDDNQVTPEDLSKRVIEIMRGETDAATAAKNLSLSNQTVLDIAKGDVEAARTYLAERAKQLGMTPETLRELGSRSPEAFTKLINPDSSTVAQGITALQHQTNVNQNVGPATEVDGHHTKAYYDNLKKEMGPNKYWNSVKIQGQYAKDAMALRERFNQ